MSESIEKDVGSGEVEETKMRRRVIRPEFWLCPNEEGDGYTGEIYLPGVDKDSIRLKMSKDYLYIVGTSDSTRYIGSFGFGCQIDPKRARSTYKEGLLKFDVPFKEVKLHSIDVKIE